MTVGAPRAPTRTVVDSIIGIGKVNVTRIVRPLLSVLVLSGDLRTRTCKAVNKGKRGATLVKYHYQ